MKRKVSIIILALVMSLMSFMAGTKVNTKNSIDLNTVIDYEITDCGLMLYTKDGSGYYLKK